jgi:alpha-tubulin suppressor-like RCC1 family protein
VAKILQNRRFVFIVLLTAGLVSILSFQNCGQQGAIVFSQSELESESLNSGLEEAPPVVTPISPVTVSPTPSIPPENFIHSISLIDLSRCRVVGVNRIVECIGFGAYSGFPEETSTKFTKVAGIENAIQIENSQYFGCALLESKKVKCWGSNLYGQLGDGTQITNGSAVEVKDLDAVKKIALGSYFVCALREDDTVWCWGRNDAKEMILGASDYYVLKATKINEFTRVKDIQIASYDGCIQTLSDSVKCWGSAFTKKISESGGAQNNYTATEIDLLNGVVQFSLESDSTICGLFETGIVSCGNPRDANGYKIPNFSILEIQGFSDVKQIASGSSSTCLVRRNNSLYCWGDFHGTIPKFLDTLPEFKEIKIYRFLSVLLKDGTVVSFDANGKNDRLFSF